MVGWHHRLSGHEFEQTPGDSERQSSLACCCPWSHRELEATQRLNNSNMKFYFTSTVSDSIPGQHSFPLSSLHYLCLFSFPPSPHTTRKETSACALSYFILIINRVIENGFFYKKQDVKYALKYSSLLTLLSRKFYNQFINLYYRYILQAMITSRCSSC